MYMYVCLYMYICICMHVYVCMYMYLCICMYVYVCVYVCVYMYVQTLENVCMYVYVCVCIHVCVCMHNILGGIVRGEMSYPKREGELSGGVIVRGELSRGNCPTPEFLVICIIYVKFAIYSANASH